MVFDLILEQRVIQVRELHDFVSRKKNGNKNLRIREANTNCDRRITVWFIVKVCSEEAVCQRRLAKRQQSTVDMLGMVAFYLVA